MAASYIIDVEHGVVYTKGWGLLTAVEAAAQQAALRDDPDFDPTYRQLIDFTGLEGIVVPKDAARDLARRSPWSRRARRAVVAPRDVVFGMVRWYEGIADLSDEHYAVFRTMAPALEWLGLDERWMPYSD